MDNSGIKHGKRLDDFTMEEYRSFSDKIDEDIREAINLVTCVKARRSYGGTAPDAVAVQIKHARELLAREAAELGL
jgi:argininosuccinate lyase